MTDTHKIIAVYGNTGSFKTSTSVNLAKALSKASGGANVAVVGLDHTKPLIPLLFPETKMSVSFGKLLSAESLDQDAILSQTHMNEYFGVLGYNSGENINSYAFPTDGRIDDFLMQMRHLMNYTIIDCTSDVTYKLTAKTLINADEVIYLISCDINGLVFYQSQEPILLSEQYGYNRFSRYLTITGKFIQDEATMQNAVTQVNGIIPYSESLSELWNQNKSFVPLSDVKYNKAINDIAVKVTEG